jgi:hypothetical protein
MAQKKKTVIEERMAKAYGIAVRLAAQHTRAWIVTGYVADDDRNVGCSRVFDALTAAKRTEHSFDALQASVAEHIADKDIACETSDQITSLYTDALDSGYLYGVALGLQLGRGGLR